MRLGEADNHGHEAGVFLDDSRLFLSNADAYGLIQGFTGNSSALVSDLSDQIRTRTRYDDEYLANKTR